MIPEAAVVRLTPADRAVLEARIRAPTTEQRDVRRGRLPACSARCRGPSVRGAAGLSVTVWLDWATNRIQGQRRPTVPRPVAAFWRCWIGSRRPDLRVGPELIATELGDVHEQYVWRFLRTEKIDLSGRLVRE